MDDERLSVELETPVGISGKISGSNSNGIVIVLLIVILFASVLGNGFLYAEFSSCRTDVSRLKEDILRLEADILILEGLTEELGRILQEIRAFES